jgi:uncharacterized protein YtpQ (UPF0354 family)
MVKIFPWRGRTNKKAFVERFRVALLERVPDAVIEDGEELVLRVLHPAQNYTQTVRLSRAYEEFCKTPANAGEIVSRWVGSVAAMASGTLALDPDRIIPVVKDHSWLRSQGDVANGEAEFDPWYEPYNSELVIVFAEFNDGLSFCDQSSVDALGIPRAELRERAFANLRRVIKQVTVTGQEGEFILGAGGTIDSSLLLMDEVTHDPRMKLAGNPLVGVSDRDSFWLADDANPFAVFGIALKVARYHRSEPYPVSDQLFYRQAERWMPLDPDTEDESHPIPNLTVIDIVGKRLDGGVDLVIVIASPLIADARSIFRLSRKLDGYLREINSETWRAENPNGTAESTRIIVKPHPDSDPVITPLLNAYSNWVKSQGAVLEVEELELDSEPPLDGAPGRS